MKRLALLLTIFIMALSVPLQASAASLYEVRKALKDNYYGELTGDIYDAQTINELMSMVKDPYTVYFTAEEYRQFFQSIEQQMVGIGVVIEANEKGVYISDVLNGGPASAAGLKAGDIITRVDNISLVGMSINNAVQYITGPENTSVTLTILRTDGTTNTLTLIRKTIQSPNVVSSLLYGNVGYIYLASFSDTAAKEVSDAIGQLKKAGATRFIFDIQKNGGGYVDTAIDMISLFPNAVNAFELIDNSGRYIYSISDSMSTEARYYNKFPQQVALLIDGGSASASEMTAAAVKDQQLAKIYGKTSYGKGLMQNIEGFQDGSALKVTSAEFRSPNGHVINKVGVKPDNETATPIQAAHFDLVKAQLKNYKALPALTDVPTTKTFTISFSKDVQASTVTNNIELVALGGQKIEISKAVKGSKITVTPATALLPGAQYALIVHPTMKDTKGKALKAGTYMQITVAK